MKPDLDKVPESHPENVKFSGLLIRFISRQHLNGRKPFSQSVVQILVDLLNLFSTQVSGNLRLPAIIAC